MPAQAAAPSVETLIHDEATRKSISAAEYRWMMPKDEPSPVRFARGGQYCYPALEHVLRSLEGDR